MEQKNEVTKESVIVFPEPVYSPSIISGIEFLYFEEPLIFLNPPTVVSKNSFDLVSYIQNEAPAWTHIFDNIFNSFLSLHSGCKHTSEILEPLKNRYINVFLSYAGNQAALKKARNTISSLSISNNDIINSIQFELAAAELTTRHILLEEFLERGESLRQTYKYCNEIFTSLSYENLLVESYYLRFVFLNFFDSSKILLSNPRILNFISSHKNQTSPKPHELTDIAAWELFRQILSGYIQKVDNKTVELICELLSNNIEEITSLKSKCVNISTSFPDFSNQSDLISHVEYVIKNQIRPEIESMFGLDKKLLKDFLTNIFSDMKFWASYISLIYGISAGNKIFTSVSAIGATSIVSASLYKSLSSIANQKSSNEYRLLYSIKQKDK